MYFSLLSIYFYGPLMPEINATMSCQVQVEQGILQGKQCVTFYGKKYYSFEGIPYAKPPVGKLRFRPPQEPENWTGIRDATKPGNKCCQVNPYANSAFEGSEDCLYLNVYTPRLPEENTKKLPVLFFVHGGRLIFGYGDYYQPDYLIKHDVILVTVNFRLNILGFLCLNIPEVPGNAALKDTIMALRWVNKNIGFFNGDATNVTVSGESAGAAMISSCLTSKMADGLYHKLITQSGSLITDLMFDKEDPVNKAKVVASNLGKQFTDVRSLYEFLVEVPVEDLIIAFSMAEISRSLYLVRSYFSPVIEKEFDGVERFFDEYPLIDIVNNRFKKVPVVAGISSHEVALFMHRVGEGNWIFENDFLHYLPNVLLTKRDYKIVGEIDRKIRDFYFGHKPINETTKVEYINLLSDMYFNFDIINLVELLSKFYKNVYLYIFQYSGNMNTRVMKNLGLKGACHGDMIQYQFYRKGKHDKCSEKDIEIVEMLSEAWCNFAKNGMPSWSERQTKWLPYTPKEKQVLLIDDKTQLVKNPFFNRFQFWLSITGEISKL